MTIQCVCNTPLYREVGNVHTAGAVMPLQLNGTYRAVSIAPFSQVDACYAEVDGRKIPLDVASPIVAEIRQELNLHHFYGQGGSTYNANLAVALWPHVPRNFTQARGPDKNASQVTGSITTTESTLETIPTYGRRVCRMVVNNANATAALIRFQALKIIDDTPTVRTYPVSPVPGDSSEFTTVNASSLFELNVEGWEFVQVRGDIAAGSTTVTIDWSVHD